jgi:hypothetical protein
MTSALAADSMVRRAKKVPVRAMIIFVDVKSTTLIISARVSI